MKTRGEVAEREGNNWHREKFDDARKIRKKNVLQKSKGKEIERIVTRVKEEMKVKTDQNYK